jgi:uncharacterized protein (TIGR01244 family)
VSDAHHPDAPTPLGNPWPSVAAALVVAAAVAGGLVWQARQDRGAVHGATHYHEVDPLLATAGSLLPGAPELLKAQGFEVVIDLRTAGEAGQPEERALVEAAGMRYLSTPVAGQPTRDDFAPFSRALAAERGNKVLVHCSSNKRASALVMVHRVTREGVPLADARRAMAAVWQPRQGWKDHVAGLIADPPPLDPVAAPE